MLGITHPCTCTCACACTCVCVCVVAFPEEDESSTSGSEDEDGPKLRSALPSGSNPVPLGWPKVNTLIQCIYMYIYTFSLCVSE